MEDEYKQKQKYEKPTTSWRRVVQEGMLATSVSEYPIMVVDTKSDLDIEKQDGFDSETEGIFEVNTWNN